jgi:hypothetical protein
MSDLIFPYKTVRGDIDLKIIMGRLDDGDFPKDPFLYEQRLITLYDMDKEEWGTVAFDLEIVGPEEEIRALDADGVQCDAIVIAHCAETNFRQTARMSRINPQSARWYGTIELHRGNFRGKVDLAGLITGTVDMRRCRYLGESSVWKINFDEPDLPPLHGTLRVKWADFSDPGDDPGYLKEYVNQPFFSDLVSRVPTVFLNRSNAFRGFPSLLDDRRRTQPYDRALHNSERIGIARSVWMAMLNVSSAAIQEGEDGTDPDWPTENWKHQVLQILIPRIYPDLSDHAALKQLQEDWKSRDSVGALESRAEAAIGDVVQAGTLLKRSLEDLARTSIILSGT